MATTATFEENLNNSRIPTERQNSEELNGQQGKRKFSLSQYQERKRLRPEEFHYADTDMRIFPNKVSPPTTPTDVPTKCDEPTPIVMKSNLSEPGVKKETKKKVIWADEKNQSLVQTSFFEVDDSELAEMHLFARPSAMSNMSIAQLEKVMERDFRQRRGLQTENQDDKQTLAPLAPLIKILLPEHIHPATVISQERLIQEEREKTVFQALLIRSFLPDSPAEPDQELSSERQEAKLIPLDDDANGNKTSISTCPSAAPVSSQSTSNKTFPFADLSPEVAQILAQAKGNTITANNPSATTTTTPTTTTTTTTTTTALPNLPAPPNFLSTLFNVQRTDSTTVPSNNHLTNLLPNLAVNFNLPPPPPPPTQFPLGHLLASALSLALPPPTNNTPPPMFPQAPTKVPSVRFVSAIGQQTRPTVPSPPSNNEHSNPSIENSRDQYRRHQHQHQHQHQHHHRNQHQRRDYHQNRSNSNSNNRNLY